MADPAHAFGKEKSS